MKVNPISEAKILQQDEPLRAEESQDRVREGVRLQPMLAPRSGTDLSEPSRKVAVGAMADAALATQKINGRLGAFYTTARVQKVLGDVARRAVKGMVTNEGLLQGTAADGVVLFPAFQFANGALPQGFSSCW